jgi:hypothetical protein
MLSYSKKLFVKTTKTLWNSIEFFGLAKELSLNVIIKLIMVKYKSRSNTTTAIKKGIE